MWSEIIYNQKCLSRNATLWQDVYLLLFAYISLLENGPYLSSNFFTVLVWKGLAGHTYLWLERKAADYIFFLTGEQLLENNARYNYRVAFKDEDKWSCWSHGVNVEEFIAHWMEKGILWSEGSQEKSETDLMPMCSLSGWGIRRVGWNVTLHIVKPNFEHRDEDLGGSMSMVQAFLFEATFFFFLKLLLFLEAIKTLLRNPSHSRNLARTASWFKFPIGNRDFSADDTSTHNISGSLFWPEVTPDWDSSWEKKLWGLAHRNTQGQLTFSEGFCGFTLSVVGLEFCGSTGQMYSSGVVL